MEQKDQQLSDVIEILIKQEKTLNDIIQLRKNNVLNKESLYEVKKMLEVKIQAKKNDI